MQTLLDKNAPRREHTNSPTRLTVNLSSNMHRALKVHATLRGTTIRQLVTDLIENAICEAGRSA